jgi:hypothetical protein
MTIACVDGSFRATGQSAPVLLHGCFNLSLSGPFVAQLELQRSFDGGITWRTVEVLTASGERIGDEPERRIAYRLACTSHTSGTVNYRLSQ